MSWLFAAFAVVWIAIFIYVFALDRKQTPLSDELASLKSRLDETD